MPTSPSNSIPTPPDFRSGKAKKRTLVLCFDGTADSYDESVTNVVKLYSLLKKDNVEEQLCYYQAGIGTYLAPGYVTSIFQWFAKTLDQAVAWYLYQHVIDGYKFLMQNYKDGDNVCLFGFSRGAYTARALGGMLHRVGLLSKDNTEQIPFAYDLYKCKRTDESHEDIVSGFKKTFCRSVPIEFLGVWDTVASVGVMISPSLPYVDENTTIKVFRQALSLDERRAKFCPSLYRRGAVGHAGTHLHWPDWKILLRQVWGILLWPVWRIWPGPPENQKKTQKVDDTDVLEMWFAGCHADVGGGNVGNKVTRALANIPLRWMIEQIILSRASIQFDNDAFARWHILGEGKTLPKPVPGEKVTSIMNEDVYALDAQDALEESTDQLFKAPLWWILEIWPTSYKKDDGGTGWWPHFAHGRDVPSGSLFHESVEIRRKNPKLKYEPKACCTKVSSSKLSNLSLLSLVVFVSYMLYTSSGRD